jgi:FkbM family methyltransferase
MLLFDIGANIGKWALDNYNDNTTIVSLEASPATYAKLVKNCNSKNIICLNYAVTSSSANDVDFFDCKANTISTLDEEWLKSKTSRFCNQFTYKKIKVNTITIDKLISMYGVPDLLKVDVEGAENIVLKSLTQPIKTICFEWASEWNEKTFEALNHLESLGYNKFHIQDSDNYIYRPSSFFLDKNQVVNILKSKVQKVDWGMIWCSI